jgi:hypothetical protein
MSRILLLLAPEKRKLNDAALERISAIFADNAQISLGSVVLPAIVDKSNPILVVWGLVAAVLFWLVSIFITTKING